MKMSARKKEKLEQMSHKVIEKRRRDRINNCLAELSQAVPAAFAKQSSGKLEKAEILEMTVQYLRAINALGQKLDDTDWLNPIFYTELQRHYAVGYGECVREVLRYVTEVEGLEAADGRCVRMMTYLQHRMAAPQMVGADGSHHHHHHLHHQLEMPIFDEILSQRNSPSSDSKLQTSSVSSASGENSKDTIAAMSIDHHNHHQVRGPTVHPVHVPPLNAATSSLLHGSRWSHCLACHDAANFSRKSTDDDHVADYLGLQFVSKTATTSASANITPYAFYHH